MKLVFYKSLCLSCSIFLAVIFILGLFYLDDFKVKLQVCPGLLLFALFFFLANFTKVEYDDKQIIWQIWIFRKEIIINRIIEIYSGGYPGLVTVRCTYGMFYLPYRLCMKEMNQMFDHILENNPDVVIYLKSYKRWRKKHGMKDLPIRYRNFH